MADNKEHTSHRFDWTLGTKLRDGRYGPVFLGLRTETGDLISAEEFTPPPGGGNPDTALESVVASLDARLRLAAGPTSHSLPNVVSILGYEVISNKGGGGGGEKKLLVVLTEYVPGGTLRDLVQRYGAVPAPLARSILRQVVLGLEQLRASEAHADPPVLLDLDMVMLDNRGVAKIEAPLLLRVTTPATPATARLVAPPLELLLPLPGRREGEDLGKADTWLLGVVAAQMLTGNCNLDLEGASTGSVAARIREFQGSSAVGLLVPEGAAGKLDGDALDLIRQCLSMDVDRRPSISELLEHPFLKGAD